MALKLKKPLKLTHIKAKGIVRDGMSALQLVFENGIESPLFDGGQQGTTELETFEVPDRPVTRITGTSGGAHISRIILTFEDNQHVTVFPQSKEVPKYDIEVPPKHAIVGIYGTYNYKFIGRLGFIVMPQ